MSPAQRRRRLISLKSPKGSPVLFKLAVAALLILGVLLLLLVKTSTWKSSKLSLVINRDDGAVMVSTFDKKAKTITNILIPGNTQLSVARELGSWKVKSIWKLGENEGLGGRLLSETIVKNFAFPVSGWGGEAFSGFAEGNYSQMAKAVFSGETSLGVGDKLGLMVFSLGVKTPNRIEVDLSKGPYLKKVRLVDGELGYSVTGLGLERLYPVFSEPEISQKGLRVEIVDKTGGAHGVSERLAKTTEVLGAKVASLEKGEKEDVDCLVSGKNKDLVKKIVAVYSCKPSSSQGQNFDTEITIGEDFARRF